MAAGRQETKLDLVIGAVDRFTAPLRALNERVANNTQGVRRLGSAMSQLNQEAGISVTSSSEMPQPSHWRSSTPGSRAARNS